MPIPQHEPTLEEILASIRDIISEDTPKAAPTVAEAPKGAPEPNPVKPPEMKVLELAQEVVQAPVMPVPEPSPDEEPIDAKAEEIIFERKAREPAAASANDIFPDHTRKAMQEMFDSIPEDAEPAPTRPQDEPAAVDGSSVESVFERAVRESFEPVLWKYLGDNSQLVIERMKPLIREWMDANFPALLEKAIRGEVGRIVNTRTRH